MAGIRELYDQVILPTYAPPPPVFARAAGSRLWDEDGKEYIDFGGGVAVLSLGHCPPALVRAIGKQAAQLMHLSNLHVSAPAVRAAQLLVQNTFAARVFWCNSGAEANEAALKLARRRGVEKAANKTKVLSFANAFHGRVGLAMAATPKPAIRDGFGPLAPGFCASPYNDLAEAEAALSDDFCAIIVEPVQGEGGVNVASGEFLRGLRKLADRHDALLIFDEVQSGAGRTGALYAYMHSGAQPDVLTTAKGLGGGFPVGAMLAAEAAAAALPVGVHGTTYGGNALAAAAAEAVLQQLLEDGFLDGVAQRAAAFAARLDALNRQHRCFSEIRQSGLLIGCELAGGRVAADVAAAALAQGLIAITAGATVLRLAPALNIPEEDIAEGFARLEQALAG